LSVRLLKYKEHYNKPISETDLDLSKDAYQRLFKKIHRGKDVSLPCFSINKTNEATNSYHLKAGYFIGVGWVDIDKTALYIEPKYKKIDFITMLFSSLRHPEVAKEIDELFEVKWDQPIIEIQQKQDFLTPFLVVEFLAILKTIVRKGLKRSYYRVEQNLHSKVKGKVLVSKTIKHNILQNKNLYTYCSYSEFGLDNKENRLLKKALTFVKRYLPQYAQLTNNKDLQNVFNYINPAFHKVSDKIELNEIKRSKTNVFYQEYKPALRLAKLILKRFGYNISNTVKDKIQTPPFWIDMSKLFELYVLGLLKDRFHNQVEFQFKSSGNELDYLLKAKGFEMVIDAKYKFKYAKEKGKDNKDVRQVSGYARLRKVYEALGKEKTEIIDCLIIYPNQESEIEDLKNVNLTQTEIPQYFNVYKLGVKLPLINRT